MRVLVVDDVGYIRHHLEQMLSAHGHSVVTAESGTAALDVLTKDNGIDVVLTDLIMPGMDGVELFRKSKSIDRLNDDGGSEPPCFLLMTALRPGSASPSKETALLQRAIDVGFTDVLFKPLERDELLTLLDSIANGENSSGNDPVSAASRRDEVLPKPTSNSRQELIRRLEELEVRQRDLERRASDLGDGQSKFKTAVPSAVSVDAEPDAASVEAN